MKRAPGIVSIAIACVCLAFSATSARAELCSRVFSPRDAEIVPQVIVLSAPSGGGKTTLAQLVEKDFNNLSISVSSTTRAPRGAERDGADYHFLTVDNFKTKIAQGQFAEWAEVHGNFYGTDLGTIRSEFAKGHSVLALVDVNGAEKLKEAFPGQVVTIFILPPDPVTLEARLRARGTDSDAAIKLRLANAAAEMAQAKSFDISVVNGDLDVAHRELADLMRQFGMVPN